MSQRLELILDSGAFTAWSRGQPVDLDEYIAYILANIEGIDHYVALDVIPGEFGRTPSAAEVEISAAQSWKNLLYMQSHGLDPVPVFHQGEQFKWVHRMIEHGCKYIGISPANDRTTAQKQLWLDRVFTEICDADGWPKVKTHAFGMTSIPLLIRYPWYSADSTRWVIEASLGGVMTPRSRQGKPCYMQSPQVVFFTERQKSSQKVHWRDLTPQRREQVREYLTEAGITPEQVAEDYKARAKACAHFFRRFGQEKIDRPWKPVKRHLFKDI